MVIDSIMDDIVLNGILLLLYIIIILYKNLIDLF